jgi:putative ABC transport system permease protein
MIVRIFGLRPRTLLHFYLLRLRKHPLQELLAGLGIAVGVALVFAVQVANTSITGSATQVVQGIVGSAQLQLAARSDSGFDERVAARVRRLPDVRHSAPLLRTRVAVIGPRGRRAIEFIGATAALADLGGDLTKNFGRKGLRIAGGIALPSRVARAVGVSSGGRVRLLAAGRARTVTVGAVLGSDAIGALASSQASLAQLPLVQRLSGRPGRLSQILVEPKQGRERAVRRELRALAGDELNVSSATTELNVLRQAAKPNDESTSLFAGISAMVGFLFAVNAMLITAAERRRFIADLRIQGFAPKQVVAVIAFEALMLGGIASLTGLVLGDLLSRLLFNEVPEYLAFAFPVGSQRVVLGSTVAFAFAGGVLATVVASLRPVLDLRSGVPLDVVFREGGEPGEAVGRRAIRLLLLAGLALMALTTAFVLLVPALTIVGGVTLAIAALLVLPAAFSGFATLADRMTRRTRRLNMLVLALMELRGAQTRSMALAAVAALAVYGSVAIGGARSDVVHGLDRHTTEWLSNADAWVTTGGQDLMTNSFPATDKVARVGSAPGVAAVRLHRGGFLDVGQRRLWVIGRPPNDRTMIPPSQLMEGSLTSATAKLRRGSWATVSDALAESWHLSLGDRFVLPTPTGSRRYRLAAITTNLGWIPGAITLNGLDYARAFGTSDPSAMEVDFKPGVSALAGKHSVQQALGLGSGLRVQTRYERERQYFAFGRQGVTRLTQIALLVLVAAALAIACALAATIWQRRPRFASLKIQGLDHRQLWRALLFETAFLMTVGCVVGSLLGMYGHFLAGRYVKLTTGFAAPFSLGGEQVLLAAALVGSVALVVGALPGYLAAQVPMRASFQE